MDPEMQRWMNIRKLFILKEKTDGCSVSLQLFNIVLDILVQIKCEVD